MFAKRIFISTIVLAVLSPAICSLRFRRQSEQATTPNTSEIQNLTNLLNSLNMTLYFQSASPQIQSAIQNLTNIFQNQSSELGEIIQTVLQNQNASLQALNFSQGGLQIFLENFQNQLNAARINASSTLSASIANLQSLYNSSANSLQQFAETVGQDASVTAANLQEQLFNLTLFLQNGLAQRYNTSSGAVQQNIQSLSNLISSGNLNRTLISIITNLQGQTLNFGQALSVLQQQATNATSTELQRTVANIQTGFQLVQQQFQNLLSSFAGFLTPTTTTTEDSILVG